MDKHAFVTVPHDESAMLDLMASKPVLWEYLLFAYYLRSGLAGAEVKWRDFTLGYSMKMGPRIAREDTLEAVKERLSQMTHVAVNVERIISPKAQEASFGKPGEPGDAGMIKHTADRLIRSYEQLLDWADEFRSLRFAEETDLGDLGARLVAQMLHTYREFVREYIVKIETAAHRINSGETGLTIELPLTFEYDRAVGDLVLKEAVRIRSGG